MEKRKFWVKLRDSEHSILVECYEDDFEKTGLVRFNRINKEGESSVVMFNTDQIEVVNEHNED